MNRITKFDPPTTPPEVDHPREDRREEGVDSQAAGYLYVSSDTPWPTGDGQALLNRLPPFMKEMAADGTERIRADARGDLPERLFVDATGRVVGEPTDHRRRLIYLALITIRAVK